LKTFLKIFLQASQHLPLQHMRRHKCITPLFDFSIA